MKDESTKSSRGTARASQLVAGGLRGEPLALLPVYTSVNLAIHPSEGAMTI